ncbi:MAG: hypothetical protein SGI87_09190 [Flavobacteriales bacterium]|nr:hypothetical protein [Flavobacteriales bacterium]
MRRKTIGIQVLFFLSISLLMLTCKKDELPPNPYANTTAVVENENPDLDDLPVGSFGWIHGKIFKPTCANVGCHDGTFEPEFRTIASAYNSLVNHPVVNNNPENSFSLRVIPGDTASSWLHERLTKEVENTQGQMPLDFDPDSDWPSNSAYFIEQIEQWILNGAPDMFGNPAPSGTANMPPMVYGLVAFPNNNTTTPYPREADESITSILVESSQIDIWILPFDDNALATGFESVSIKASTSLNDFSAAIDVPCSISGPVLALDFGNSPNNFHYKATLDLSAIPIGTTYYLRCYVDDGVQSQITEIPNASSNYFYYLLFSLKVSS